MSKLFRLRLSLGRFVRSRWGKVVLGIIAVLLIASASASVYTFFYANNTATVEKADVRLLAGPDASASCTTYPCATVVIAPTNDTATVALSMFAANTGASPVPGTYFSNIVQVKNYGTATHSIKEVQVWNIGGQIADLGQIVVWYCTTQTEFNLDGTLVTPADCVGSFSIVSSTGGSISGTFPVTLGASSINYIEIEAYAASSATASTSITFNIGIQWV